MDNRSMLLSSQHLIWDKLTNLLHLNYARSSELAPSSLRESVAIGHLVGCGKKPLYRREGRCSARLKGTSETQ